MVSQSDKSRIQAMISSLMQIQAGKNSTGLEVTSKNDDLDKLAQTINTLLQKNEKPVVFFPKDTTGIVVSNENEKHYLQILDRMQESYFETDLAGNFIFFNERLSKALGYAAAEIRGMNFRKIMEAEHAGKAHEKFHQLFVTGEPIHGCEWQVVKKNGSKMDIETSATLLYGPDGKPAGFYGISHDITRRKQTERKLKASEERYRDIVSSIEESYFEADLHGNLLFVNDSSPRDLQYSRKELQAKNFRIFTDDENAKKVYRAFHQVYLTGKPVKALEWKIFRKDGHMLDVESSVTLMRDDESRPCGFRGITRDVSQRKETEERLRLITENIRDVIWTRDFDLNLTYISPSIYRMTGYSPEEVMSSQAEYLSNHENLDWIKQQLAEKLEYGKAHPFEKNGPMRLETRIKRKDGTVIWVEVNASFNRDENGLPSEIIGVTRDITERKKAEESLKESEKLHRMIMENMQDSISILDLNFNYVYQSPSEIRVTGYTSEEIVKIPIEQQVTPESLEKGINILFEELRKEFGGTPVDPHRSIVFEIESYRKDGGTVWLEETCSFQRDKNGKPVGILLSGRNITERKKAQQERDKLAAQLLHSQKMETVGRLAGGVAHDFNNMLNVILGYIDLAKMRLTMENPIYSDLHEIEKAAIRSRDLTAQLLAFSRKQIISPKVVNLNNLVAEMQKTITRLIGEDIDLKFYPAENLWPIKFDPLQIEQILINLAVNARDAMHKGGKLVIETVNISADDNFCDAHIDIVPGDYVQLSVSDTGSGIAKASLPYLFEPFFTTKEFGRGTGLGLSTVYGIVKQNNGFISVYSEQDKGSTFKIYIPRTGEALNIPAREPERAVKSGSGTILLVEDDEMVLKMVSDMLEALGYMVIASENPQDALSLCEKSAAPIDLVITDVVMPQMSGKELRDKLVARRPDMKILFMSGYTSNIIAQHGVLEEGMQFIQKPFSINLLAEKVKRILAAR